MDADSDSHSVPATPKNPATLSSSPLHEKLNLLEELSLSITDKKKGPIPNMPVLVKIFSQYVLNLRRDNPQSRRLIKKAKRVILKVFETMDEVNTAWKVDIRGSEIDSNSLFRSLTGIKGNFQKEVVEHQIAKLIFTVEQMPEDVDISLEDNFDDMGVPRDAVPEDFSEIKKYLVCFFVECMLCIVTELDRTKGDRTASTLSVSIYDDNISKRKRIPLDRTAKLGAKATFSAPSGLTKVNLMVSATKSQIQKDMNLFVEQEVSLGGSWMDSQRAVRITSFAKSCCDRLESCGSLHDESFSHDLFLMAQKIKSRLLFAAASDTPVADAMFAEFQVGLSQFVASQAQFVASQAPKVPALKASHSNQDRHHRHPSKAKHTSESSVSSASDFDLSGSSSDGSSSSLATSSRSSHSSHRKSRTTRAERKRAECLQSLQLSHPLDRDERAELSIAQLLPQMMKTSGVLSTDALGQIHKISMKKNLVTGNKGMEIDLMYGSADLAEKSKNNPFSAARPLLWLNSLEGFRESVDAEMAAVNDAIRRGPSAEQRMYLDQCITSLSKYRTDYSNIIKSVLAANPQHHVSTLAICATFHHCNWNRAFAHKDPTLLHHSLNARFGEKSRGLTAVNNRVPAQDIQEAACIMGYYCTKCARIGMCDSMCYHCPTSAGSPALTPTQLAEFKTWQHLQPKNADVTKKAWMAISGVTVVAPTAFSCAADYWAYVAQNQQLYAPLAVRSS